MPGQGAPLGDECLKQRPAVRTGGIDRGGHRHQTVRVGRADHRAVISVADRERIGERVVKRDVCPVVVAHRLRGALRTVDSRGIPGAHPAVHLAAVPGAVLWPPLVADIRQAYLLPETERRDGLAAESLLEEHFLCRSLVAVAPDAAECPEVMVERPVLLHEDDHVLDVLQRAVLGCRRSRLGEQRLEAAAECGQPDPRGADVAQRAPPGYRRRVA